MSNMMELYHKNNSRKEIMIEVDVRGDIEIAIRQLKKKLQLDGIKKELKRREFYEKPSDKKRRKQAEARRKVRKVVWRMKND